ncbi:hypothetical protein [Chromobacterium haemolyticum]|uniref:hypothetical protein n=1 Tax=Chromobacterium haemolyticum TaxID=394935 RepID=UPI004056F1B1
MSKKNPQHICLDKIQNPSIREMALEGEVNFLRLEINLLKIELYYLVLSKQAGQKNKSLLG